MKTWFFTRLRFAAVALLVAGLPAHADTVIPDDYIVQGGVCVGLDCVSGQDFSNSGLVLKENNTRIRFYHNSSASDLGASWGLTANDSADGGAAYLGIDFESAWALKLGASTADYVAIGGDSAIEAGRVSVGRPDLLRRLVNVAEGLSDANALIKRQMESSLIADRLALAEDLQAQVAALEAEIDTLEQTVVATEEGTSSGSRFGGWGNGASLALMLIVIALGRSLRFRLRDMIRAC